MDTLPTKTKKEPHPNNVRGETHPSAKLTELDIAVIRRMYKTGNYLQRHLAAIFKISSSHMNHIVNNKVWKHLK